MSNSRIFSLIVILFLLISFSRAQTSESVKLGPAATPVQSEKVAAPTDRHLDVGPILTQHTPTQPQKILINVRSDTVYMKSATMRSWLQRQSEFLQLRLEFTAAQGNADYYVEITRPLFTWDWTYSVVKTGSGHVVGSGKVTEATAERAAKAIAPRVIRVLYAEKSASVYAQPGTEAGSRSNEVPLKKFVAREELARKLVSSKIIAVHSSTVWFNELDLEKALRNRPEFSGWDYRVPTAQSDDDISRSDLVVEVNRPLFTWDWTYVIQERSTKKNLVSGKVTAISGPAAAPMLAQSIVGAIASVRGFPASMKRQFDQALAETNVRTWELKHVSGQSHLETGQKIHLAVGQNTVYARDGENILFSVPVQDLLQFSYSSSLRDRSVKWFAGWEKAGEIVFSGAGEDPQAAAGALMIALPMLAIEYGVGGLLKHSMASDHFLILHWKDLSGLSFATLQGSESDVQDICRELQKFSKSSPVDLDAAVQNVHRALEQALDSTSYYVDVDRSLTVENTVMLSAKYRLVILPREGNLAEVYFLRPTDNSVVARTLTEYAKRSESDRSTHISYGTVSGLPSFEEIQIDEHILRFSPVPILPQEV